MQNVLFDIKESTDSRWKLQLKPFLNIFVCKLWFFYVYFYRVSLLSSERRFLLTVIVVPVEADVAGHGGWSGGHRVYGGCS